MLIPLLNRCIRSLVLLAMGLSWLGWDVIDRLDAQEIQLRAIEIRGGVDIDVADDEPDDEENPRPQEQNFFIEEANFENWIWQGAASTMEAGRERLQTLLDIELSDVMRNCQLDEAQRKKLLLAGRLDIQRFLDRYQRLRRKFLKIRTDQNAMNAFWGEMSPLQQEIQGGLFGNNSLFRGVIAKTLSAEQNQQFEAASLERRMYRMRAKLELLLVAADEGLALRAEQRDRLQELCLANLKPPRRSSPYDTHVVMYQLSRIPDEKLQAILNDRQLKFWKGSMAQFGINGGMVNFLKANGVWPEGLDDPAEPQPGVDQPPAEDRPAVDPQETP
ncbi:MAG: hypothetical protein ACK6D3_02135 [Planctomycetaceae bacterium]